MANVFLSTDAYARLKAAKKEGESFSDVIITFIPQEINWGEFLGSCKGIGAKKLYAQIKKERER
ncbi:hypothetical protein HY993_04150 [Candidatus Micrarchaeota archaeon]|nr:hypothetical protein [Candidatus Micrarchaeota archaeon]